MIPGGADEPGWTGSDSHGHPDDPGFQGDEQRLGADDTAGAWDDVPLPETPQGTPAVVDGWQDGDRPVAAGPVGHLDQDPYCDEADHSRENDVLDFHGYDRHDSDVCDHDAYDCNHGGYDCNHDEHDGGPDGYGFDPYDDDPYKEDPYGRDDRDEWVGSDSEMLLSLGCLYAARELLDG